MDFPIISLIDEESAQAWVLNHFHPQGLLPNVKQAWRRHGI